MRGIDSAVPLSFHFATSQSGLLWVPLAGTSSRTLWPVGPPQYHFPLAVTSELPRFLVVIGAPPVSVPPVTRMFPIRFCAFFCFLFCFRDGRSCLSPRLGPFFSPNTTMTTTTTALQTIKMKQFSRASDSKDAALGEHVCTCTEGTLKVSIAFLGVEMSGQQQH